MIELEHGAELRRVSLDDKYTNASGPVLMNGVQALVRLTLLQRERDRMAGLNTAGYVSGYRGSPVGSVDLEFWRAQRILDANDIVFEPGVNEDLAATAVWGTQMLGTTPGANRDGVFALWYGKGPGVDRSGDPFKHGNTAGTHPHGGVLIVAGDDHSGKSSTVAHQSEFALMDARIPILAPSNVQDVLVLGLLGIAMSRYTGLYTGFKLSNEVLEQTMVVEIPVDGALPAQPDKGVLPPEGVHNFPTHVDRQRSEIVLKRFRWPLVERFVDANAIDRVAIATAQRRLGIVTAGKAYLDVVQALQLLGLDDARAAALGVSVLKLGCVYPLSRRTLTAFAAEQGELLVIEEKEPLIENQAKAILYGGPHAPRILGKDDEDGIAMIPSDVQLEPIRLACVITERLRRLGVSDVTMTARADALSRQLESLQLPATDLARAPYFCSGCPHNTSTRTPEGSIAAGGIGCHAMAMYSGPAMLPNTQMGGEGAHWYSLAKFSDMPHMFQNMGDGTYYHSGLLAVRGAVAANVNMTFRILFNDAVAMTGGQPIDGPLSVGAVTRQVLAEGVARCDVVSDRPELYGSGSELAPGVKVHHRDEYDALQKEFRDLKGVTVIVYEQTCAAEKRRRRKRGKLEDPPKRMFINEDVCEGCGDCSVKSNCVSVWPNETELGRKRQIDQSNCNKDYSCVKGFCPSFVTVLDAEPRKRSSIELPSAALESIQQPVLAALDETYSIMVAGIGGTGVVTVGALLGMAAHLEGKACSVFDMTGLSQKNGAVFSHVRIACRTADLGSPRLGVGEAHLALAFDAVAGLAKESAQTIAAGKSAVVLNTRITPTAAFQRNPELKFDDARHRALLASLAGADRVDGVDATGLGLALLGDSIASNMFLLGFASQRGLLPVSPAALMRAIEINAVAVKFNQSAFLLGRLQAVDAAKIASLLPATARMAEFKPLSNVDEIVAHRVSLLTAYQDARYAARYATLVEKVAAVETRVQPGSKALAVAVARSFAKLMAYKDEYEVARLYTEPKFREQLQAAFADGMRIKYNLAPPLLAKRDPQSGELLKREYGAWVGHVFPVLARMKFLRGTWLDPFGHTAERKLERRLVDDYERQVIRIIDRLETRNLGVAVELANVPSQIRGYGHIKDASVSRAKALEASLLARFDDPAAKHAGLQMDGTVVTQADRDSVARSA